MSHSIFQEPWYLDAVAPQGWHEAVVLDHDGVAGRLPYIVRRRHSMTTVAQPPFTQTLGPWVRRSHSKHGLARDHKVLSDLESQLPDHDRFMQAFAPEAINALPFYWANYQLSLRYTYRLKLDTGSQQWNLVASRIRTEIRKAQRSLQVREGLDIEHFHAVWRKTFERQGLRAPHSVADISRLHAACKARNAGAILYAEDARGRVQAVNFFVWHQGLAHGLMSGADPEWRRSGAQTLLLWAVVQHAANVATTFDFSGSMLRGVEPLFRDLGAEQVPYVLVTREGRKMRAAMAGRAIAREARRTGGATLARMRDTVSARTVRDAAESRR